MLRCADKNDFAGRLQSQTRHHGCYCTQRARRLWRHASSKYVNRNFISGSALLVLHIWKVNSLKRLSTVQDRLFLSLSVLAYFCLLRQ